MQSTRAPRFHAPAVLAAAVAALIVLGGTVGVMWLGISLL